MGEALVLTLDGSTAVCSAALLRLADVSGAQPAWETVARRDEADGRAQARVLLRSMDEMLRETGSRASDLRAIVVGVGPGTFTGVRITVATARAAALALDIPVLGVSTLAGLTAGALEEGVPAAVQVLVAMVDARRGQVFYGVYRKTEASGASREQWVRTELYAVCDRTDVPHLVDEMRRGTHESVGASVLLVGDDALLDMERPTTGDPEEGLISVGSRLCFRAATMGAEWLVRGQSHLGEPGGPSVEEFLVDQCLAVDDARAGGSAAPSELEEVGAWGSPESVRPIYVRAPDADIHITKMRDPWGAR